MEEFELLMSDPQGAVRTLIYSPATSSLFWEDTRAALDLSRVPNLSALKSASGITKTAAQISPKQPGRKSRSPKKLKIQLGLKCNYACSYCNQDHQESVRAHSKNEVEDFVKTIASNFSMGDGAGRRIEFWGGEPFVYWRFLEPLAEKLREEYPYAAFSLITNGSLLDDQKIDWLDRLGFDFSISHDGPAHRINRGPDPFDDPTAAGAIRKAFSILGAQGRISFNCVLADNNTSLVGVRAFIAERLGCGEKEVPLTTEEVLLPYNAGGSGRSIKNEQDHFNLMHQTFWELSNAQSLGISTVETKLRQFLQSIAEGRAADGLGQTCGMDRDDQIAIDLDGNVITCQNTSAAKGHRIGHIGDLDAVSLDTAHHWATRSECVSCPVLHLCQGACMYLEGDLWQQACDNSFAYNMGVFASALAYLTGRVMVGVRGRRIRRSVCTAEKGIDLDFVLEGERQWRFQKPKRIIPISVKHG